MQDQVREMKYFPKADNFSFFNEKEKKFLKQHMDMYHEIQLQTLDKTIILHEMPASEFSWKKHYTIASLWCNVFYIPTVNWKAAAASQA
jgi:hypothetical protein